MQQISIWFKTYQNYKHEIEFLNDIDHDLTCAGVLLRDHGSDAVKELVVEVRGALEANPDVAGDNVYTELTFCNTKEMVEKLELEEDLIDMVTEMSFMIECRHQAI